MSSRTAEANKAVRKAWENERQLVLEGKGTRDWTREQQQSIIDTGKAYDDKGVSFHGHHMKSVEAYPAYQGNPSNIEFLTRDEHYDAHGGNTHIPTNGYYDPRTRLTRAFEGDPLEPCEIIKLSNPLPPSSLTPGEAVKEETTGSKKTEGLQDGEVQEVVPAQQEANAVFAENHVTKSTDTTPAPKTKIRLGSLPMRIVKSAVGFAQRHPYVTSALKQVGVLALIKAGTSLASKGARSNSGISKSPSTPEVHENPITSLLAEESASTVSRNYPTERSSPRAHDVSGYTQMRNGKPVAVRSYPRGGKNKKGME